MELKQKRTSNTAGNSAAFSAEEGLERYSAEDLPLDLFKMRFSFLFPTRKYAHIIIILWQRFTNVDRFLRRRHDYVFSVCLSRMR